MTEAEIRERVDFILGCSCEVGADLRDLVSQAQQEALAHVMKAHEHAKLAYEFNPGSYTYSALVQIGHAMRKLGGAA